MTTALAPMLSDDERTSLEAHEEIIERGLKTFYEVGNALAAIRDAMLYRQQYKTFEDYCLYRWDISRPRAYQMIDAANITTNLSTIVDKIPANEAQARPLTALKTPELQREAWQRVIETAPEGKITAAHVERVVFEMKSPPPSPALPIPQGRYQCIVIDPPWQIEKIARDVRPRQVVMDYPMMDESQLLDLPIPDLAADNCHLYLWTTHKYLPLALRLAEHWGFRYQCLLTWVKNVGFTPFSWMYSTEHALFCRKGSLDLLQLGRRLDFSADVREHSRKPEIFYDLVRDVSPGPRLDMFARERHEGFDVWGNEVDRFLIEEAA